MKTRSVFPFRTVSVLVMLALTGLLPAAAGAAGRGTSGASFLRLGIGAGPAGAGEAAVTLGGAAEAAAYNPAGVVGVARHTLTATHFQWIEDLAVEGVAYAAPVLDIGTIGAGVSLLHMPALDAVDAEGRPAGSVRAYDLAVRLTYADRLVRWLGVEGAEAGVSVKYLHRTLAGEQAFGAAVDVGGMFHPAPDWTLGAACHNLGYLSGFTGASESLPVTFRTGVGFTPEFLPGHELAVRADWVQPLENNPRANLGLTYAYDDWAFVRAGYKLGYDVEGFQAGAGVCWRTLTLDYAVKLIDVFGPTHMVSATLGFGTSTREQAEARAWSLLDKAERLYSEQKYTEAMEPVSAALAIAPDFPPALELRAKLQTVLEMLRLSPADENDSGQPDYLLPPERVTPDLREEQGWEKTP